MPPCYHEFLAVQGGHISREFIYAGVKSQNIINKYQFCGVRNQLHLYPKDLDLEVKYKNNKVITDSEFAFQFQVMDYGLVESLSTGVIIEEIDQDISYRNFLQKLFVAGGTLAAVICKVLVNKLSKIALTVTSPGREKYNIYSGPIIHEQFRVKNFRGSMKIPSFQCIVVVYTKKFPLGPKINFTTIRHNLPAYHIKLEKDKEFLASFPNGLCRHSYGIYIYCIIKVS